MRARRASRASLVVAFAILVGGRLPASAQADLAALQVAIEQQISAFKVATRQVEVSGTVGTQTGVQAGTGLAAVLVQHATNAGVQRATTQFGASTGQGQGVCAAPVRMQSRVVAEGSSRRVAEAMGSADARWLREGGDASARAVNLQRARQTFYCTAEERRAGWCLEDAGGHGAPAGDTDASAFMLRTDLGPEEALTAADYVDTVAPLPTVGAARDAQEALAQVRARRQGAMQSAARGALFTVVAGKVGGDKED